MAAPFFTNESCQTRAAADQTLLALSVVHLFKSGFTPLPGTTKAELTAQEADYSTYAAKTITAWLAPIKSQSGGYQISAPTVQFGLAADPAVSNMIGGYWIETAAGDVYIVGQFDSPLPMVTAGDGIDLSPTVIFPNGF